MNRDSVEKALLQVVAADDDENIVTQGYVREIEIEEAEVIITLESGLDGGRRTRGRQRRLYRGRVG